MNDYILIEYSNSTDFGDILYQNTFANKIYLDADVSKPEYELVEDGTENGDGEFFPDFQKWSKKYSITFYAQEFLLDALTLMALHNQINITLKNGESSNVNDIEIDYTWDSNIECWAEVVITFSTMYISQTGCNEGLSSGCQEGRYTADDVYQSDDSGVGEAWWLATAVPPPSNGTISFFHQNDIGYGYSGANQLGFYRFNGTVWELIEFSDGDFGEVTAMTDALFLSKQGTLYYKIAFLRGVSDETGGDAEMFCYATGVESTFYQAQYDDGGGWVDIGDPQLASAFDGGFVVSPGVGTFDFRIFWYTHSCEYGYSNEVTQTIT